MKNAKHVMRAVVGGILFCSAAVAIIGIVSIPSSGNATESAKPASAITFTYIGKTYSGVVIDNLGVGVQEIAFYPLESRVAILVSILVSDQQKSAITIHAFSLVDEAGNVYSATEDDSVNGLLNPRDTTVVPVTFTVPADLAKQKLRLRYQGDATTADIPLVVREIPSATPTSTPTPAETRSNTNSPTVESQAAQPSASPSPLPPQSTAKESEADEAVSAETALRAEDSNLNLIYQELVSQLKRDDEAVRQLRVEERAWIRQRDVKCGKDTDCLIKIEGDRAGELSSRLKTEN